jgi:hypothetical protein
LASYLPKSEPRKEAMNDHENELPDVQLDFFKHMDEIVKREAQKQKQQEAMKKQELTPNQEYQRRYSRAPHDRFWIGPQRYR